MQQALRAGRILYEPSFDWQPGTPSGGDTSINPDFLVERPDGFFDIYDLKRPLLDKPVTRGERRRRLFTSSIVEGAAQLAHYVEYFSYQANVAHALEKYGVRVDTPKATLIVGNQENVLTMEVDEALRAYSNLAILDYDSLLRLYVANSSSADQV